MSAMKGMYEEVTGIIAEVLRFPREQVTPALSIGDIPEWGSMAQMGIIAALEERLGIEIPLEDLFDLTSVEALVGEVEKLKGKG